MKVIRIVITIFLVGIPLLAAFTAKAVIVPIVLTAVNLPILIYVLQPKGKKKQKKVNLRQLPTDGHEFEYWCAGYLLRQGFREARVTPGSGDYGADIVAVDRDGNRWVVQCKLYGHPVSNSAVQEVIGAKVHYGASRAMVMTNARMTKQAKELAWENAVAIIEGLGD